MSDHVSPAGPPPERLHWIQVKLAFTNEGREPARPGRLVAVDGPELKVRYTNGVEETIEVVEADRLGRLLESDDICRLDCDPLVLVNTYYRVLGLAAGPPEPPRQLKVSLAFAFEDSSVTEVLPAGEGQPGFHTLALVSQRPSRRPSADLPAGPTSDGQRFR